MVKDSFGQGQGGVKTVLNAGKGQDSLGGTKGRQKNDEARGEKEHIVKKKNKIKNIFKNERGVDLREEMKTDVEKRHQSEERSQKKKKRDREEGFTKELPRSLMRTHKSIETHNKTREDIYKRKSEMKCSVFFFFSCLSNAHED